MEEEKLRVNGSKQKHSCHQGGIDSLAVPNSIEESVHHPLLRAVRWDSEDEEARAASGKLIQSRNLMKFHKNVE